MYKIIGLCSLLFFTVVNDCYAEDDYFYVDILAPSGVQAQSNGNVVSIDYKICDYQDNKPTSCVISQTGVGGRVGQSYSIVQSLLPNQRISAFEASLFVPNQMYPLFTQSFPILANGTTSCTSEPGKNYLTFYADAMGMKIICQP